jgi:hypothetical protein
MWGAFPGAHEIEIAEFLHQLHRLINHPLQLFVITQLDIAGEREILAQWIAGETIVGENAPQIGIAPKGNAVHVEGFALEPARGRVKRYARRNGLALA